MKANVYISWFVLASFILLSSGCNHCIYNFNIKRIDYNIDKIRKHPDLWLNSSGNPKEEIIEKIKVMKELSLYLDIYNSRTINRDLKEIIKDKKKYRYADHPDLIYMRLDALLLELDTLYSNSPNKSSK